MEFNITPEDYFEVAKADLMGFGAIFADPLFDNMCSMLGFSADEIRAINDEKLDQILDMEKRHKEEN